MNNAPFYVGQKVVCVDDKGMVNPRITPIKKGAHYTVYECWWVYSKWYLKLEEVLLHEDGEPNNYWAKRFAPIQPLYADIAAELASQVEVGDTADSSIKVLN